MRLFDLEGLEGIKHPERKRLEDTMKIPLAFAAARAMELAGQTIIDFTGRSDSVESVYLVD